MKFSQHTYDLRRQWKTKREEEKKAKRATLTIKWSHLYKGSTIRISDCYDFRIEARPYPVGPGIHYALFQRDTDQKLASGGSYLDIRTQAELFKANPNKRTDRGTRRQKPERIR